MTQPTPPQIPQAGTVLLDRYRVERQLGQGGMGVVLAVHHIDLDKLFALKLLLPHALEYPDAKERFLREARAAARLTSEHVTRVTDVGTFKRTGLPYMVMEHLEGRDLQAVLDDKQNLSCNEAALYVHQACQAVAEAHTQNIVHRDLKPANLFVTRRADNTPCIKVLDFGISKMLDPANRVGNGLTKTGVLMGSPNYMSPEQMMDHRAVDKRSDIWALGIILYECVTGRVPFHGEALTEIAVRVCQMPVIPPSLVRPGIPLEFDTVVLRCLEKDPNRRYGTVQELIAALLPFTTGTIGETPVDPSVLAHVKRPDVSDEAATLVAKHSNAPPSRGLEDDLGEDSKTTIPIGKGERRSGRPDGTADLPQLTGGAWGNTSRLESSRSDRKNRLVVVSALGALVLLGAAGIAFWNMATTNEPDVPLSGASAASTQTTAPENAAKPTLSSAPSAGHRTTPVVEPNAALPTTADPPVVGETRPTPTSHKATSRPIAPAPAPRPVQREKPLPTSQPTATNPGTFKPFDE